MRKILSTIAVLAFAGAASAAVTGLGWREVSNPDIDSAVAMGDFFSGGAWNDANVGEGSNGGWRTFDLFVLGDTGTQVNAINLGSAASPGLNAFALYTDGVVFNHGNGNNFPSNPGQPPFQALLEWDTYVAMGDTPAGNVGQVPGSIALGAAGADSGVGDTGLRGTWFGDPIAPSLIGASGELRIMRVTVFGATYLGTPGVPNPLTGDAPVSSLEVGQVGFAESFVIPNAIPAPGAVALLGLGGLAGLRRRR